MMVLTDFRIGNQPVYGKRRSATYRASRNSADYVYENPFVQAGLSSEGVADALSFVHSFTWHPLTTISHMADCEVDLSSLLPMLFPTPPDCHQLGLVATHPDAYGDRISPRQRDRA